MRKDNKKLAKQLAISEMKEDKDVTIGVSLVYGNQKNLLLKEDDSVPLTTDDIIVLEEEV